MWETLSTAVRRPVTGPTLLFGLVGMTLVMLAATHSLPQITGAQAAVITRQCNDTVDNDSDGRVDLADPNCFGPLDNSEASGFTPIGNPLCAIFDLCVRFVTHYEPPAGAEVVREHQILAGIGQVENFPATPVDATGDGTNDLAVAVAAPATLLPPGVDAERPGISIGRIAGAPATFPVKVEATVDEGSAPNRKLSFGYDTRGSTAPIRFIAKIDLRDRDGDPATDQKKVDLSINRGPSDEVTLVSEKFTAAAGLGESRRTDREISRLTYRGDSSGAHVPSTAAVDSTTRNGSERLVLTRVEPTLVDFKIDDGAAEPKITTGTIERLPTLVDLTITDQDVNGDGKDDKKIDYSATARVKVARIGISQPITEKGDPDVEGDETVHRRELDIEAHDLAAGVQVEFAAPTSKKDPPDPNAKPGQVSFDATGRTASITVTGEDEEPFFKRAKGIRLQLADVPRVLDARFGEGQVKFDAYATPARVQRDAVGRLEFSGQDVAGVPIAVPPCGEIVCFDGYNVLRDPDANGAVSEDLPDRFLLFARIHKLKSAALITEPDLDVRVDTGIDLGPPAPGCASEFPPPSCEDRSFEALIKKVKDTECDDGKDNDGDGKIDNDGAGDPGLADPHCLGPADDHEATPAPEDCPDDGSASPLITRIRAGLGTLIPGTHFSHEEFGDATPSEADDLDVIKYENDGSAGSLSALGVEAENLGGAPEGDNCKRANRLNVALSDVPSFLQFTKFGDGFPLKLRTQNQRLGLLDVELSGGSVSTGDRLPHAEHVDYDPPFTRQDTSDDTLRELEGVRIRDFPDRHVIHARMKDLKSATVDRKGARGGEDGGGCVPADELCIGLESALPIAGNPRLRLDSQKKVGPVTDSGGRVLNGVESDFATLDTVPANLLVRKALGTDFETRLAYTASDTVGAPGVFGSCPLTFAEEDSKPGCKGFHLFRTTIWDRPANPPPDPLPLPDYYETLELVPMPKDLNLCRAGGSPICSDPPVVPRTDASEGSLSIHASPRTHFRYTDQPGTVQAETLVSMTLENFAFQADSEGPGYIAFDTGWDTSGYHTPAPPPPAQLTNDSVIKVAGPTEFRFGNGFAADGRGIGWPSEAVLFLADKLDISDRLDIGIGQVLCPDGTEVALDRVEGHTGIRVHLDLTDELCNDEDAE